MSAITMHKYHGLGNDYLVFDPNKNQAYLQERKVWQLCRRNFGVGADGILYGPAFEDGKIKVSCYNADGSMAKNSGNGIRIFAKYLKDAGYVTGKTVKITVKSQDIDVEFLGTDGNFMRVNMGKADFMSVSIPVLVPLEHEIINEPFLFHGTLYNATCLSVGNPNCVIMTEDVSAKQVKELGPYVENASYFPNRMNLQCCKVENRNRLKIEVYERGAGYIMSSGTGACAAAAAAYRMGLTDEKVTVIMPGGALEIEIAKDGTLFMTGPVEYIGTFTVEEDFFS